MEDKNGELYKYDHWIKYYVSYFKLPADAFYWIKTIMFLESDYGRDPLVVKGLWSHDGNSKGVMQLKPATANDYEKVSADDLNNPELSIRIGTQHFARIYKKFGANLELAAKAYNQGEGTMAKVIASGIPNKNANKYWDKFTSRLAKVRML